jgi:hypothetical protein
MRHLLRVVALAACTSLVAAVSPAADRPKSPGASGGGVPNPFWRFQVVFPGQWEPVIGAGPLFKIPLGPTPKRPVGVSGPVTIPARKWYVYALPTLGLNTADIARPTLTGSLGVVHRRGGPIDRVGVMAFGSLQPKTIGPVLRLEALNGVVALQPGWVWRKDDGNGFVFGLDISIPFIWDACCSK